VDRIRTLLSYSESGVCLGVTIWGFRPKLNRTDIILRVLPVRDPAAKIANRGVFNRSFCLYDSAKKFSSSFYIHYAALLGTRILFSCCCARVPLRAKETNLNTPTIKCIRAYIGTYYYYFLILHIITDAIAESTVVAAAL